MAFIVRESDAPAKLADEQILEALAHVVPLALIKEVLGTQVTGPRRLRKLPAELTLLLGVAMNLYTGVALDTVLDKLLHGLACLWPDLVPATKGAISQARYKVGAGPMVALFHRVCQPLGTPETPGAFLFGLRVVGIDSTLETVPDTPENARVFGRLNNQYQASAFPLLRGVYLVECGLHAIIEAGFWPCRVSEHHGAKRVLRGVAKGMLVLWDAGLHSFALVHGTRQRQAHVLGRVPAGVILHPIQVLPDGTFLARLYDTAPSRGQREDHSVVVRVVVYTLTDPARPGYGETHRLITSLLHPVRYPATALVCAYHERWEVELTIDEIDTHQRLVNHPLRSQKPVGVIQEAYGLLVAHYAVRALMAEAAATHQLDPDRISFVHAVETILTAVPTFQVAGPAQRVLLYQRLLDDLARHMVPAREGRTNPRVVKRKVSKFPRKGAGCRGTSHLVPFEEVVRLVPRLLPRPDAAPLPSNAVA
jgi:hypothetical protein